MSKPQDLTLRRFIGDGLMAVGGLITALSGLCTTGFVVFVALPTMFSFDTFGQFVSAVGMLPWVLLFAGAPIAIGIGLILWGRRLSGDRPPGPG